MNGNTKQRAALWQCNNCGIWWCSQPEVLATRFMLELPVETLEAFGWENFRGWRLGGTPHVATCPECGSVATAPTFGGAAPGVQLQLDLGALLRPALAPAAPVPVTDRASNHSGRIRLSSMFGLGVILISLFLLGSCRPEEKVSAAEPLPEAAGIVSVSAIGSVDYEQAAANHAARWQAMAQFYADHDMLNKRFDYEQAADNQVARWQAMGLFYEKNGLLNTLSE